MIMKFEKPTKKMSNKFDGEIKEDIRKRKRIEFEKQREKGVREQYKVCLVYEK